MATFTDGTGKEWTVKMTVGSAARVKDRTGVDLLAVLDPQAKVLEQLASDPLLLYRVILAITDAPDSLGDHLDEEALEKAGEALIDGVLDFFPPWKADPLRKVIGKARRELASRQIDARDELARAAEALSARDLVDQSTSSVSAGSSPDTSE